MQKEFIALGDGDELRQRPTNFDFNVTRCKTDKLLEQMTVEKAICVLKVPQTRNSNALDKNILEGCFSNQVYKRIRVNADDPEYKKKVEGRHVLDRELTHIFQYTSHQRANCMLFAIKVLWFRVY